MKKIFALAGAALLVASCSKETTTSVSPDSRMVTYTQSEIADQLKQVDLPMPFTNGKAAALSFTLRAVAEPPIVNGVATKATSVQKVGNLVYVTWHTVNGPFGGCVSVYNVGTPGAIAYLGRIDFIDTDFHQAAVEGSNLYLVGQRDPNSGAYDQLVGTSTTTGYWNGAIFGKLGLDGSGLLTTTYSELPTSGFAANGLAATNNANVYDFITGDEASKIYRINGATMTLTDSVGNFNDGEFMMSSNGSTYGFIGDDSGTNSRLIRYSNNSTLNTMNILAGTNVTAQSVAYGSSNLDRNAMTADFSQNAYLAMGANGVIKVTSAGATVQAFGTNDVGGTSQGVSLDATNNRLYIAQGEQGLFMADVTGGAFDDASFSYAAPAYPTSNYKDVTYAASAAGAGGPENWLFIADGEKGLLLVEEINN